MTTGKTVLLVEDEQWLRKIVSGSFRNEGFEVAGAEHIGTVICVGYKFEEQSFLRQQPHCQGKKQFPAGFMCDFAEIWLKWKGESNFYVFH